MDRSFVSVDSASEGQQVSAASTPEFYVQWNEGTSGKVSKTGDFKSMCDFALRLRNLVEAGEMTGYFCECRRELDGEVRTCFFTSDAANQKMKFVSQLNKSFGHGGGFTCGFTDTELTRFIQYLKREQANDIRISKGTTMVGRQPSSSFWVMNKTTQISAKGELVTPEVSSYMWTPTCILANCDKVSLNELIPTVASELATAPLCELVDLLESACKHNFASALLILGGAIMSCHYAKITSQFGGFPIVLAIGPTETGKSTSIKAGLSLFGMAKDSFYVEGSNAYFMERSALSCLPYGIDEACGESKQFDLVKLVIDLHGGAKTANLRRGAFLPQSVPLVATNFAVKKDPRVKSRCVEVLFRDPRVGPCTAWERKKRQELETSMMGCRFSAAIGWIIGLGEGLEEEHAQTEIDNILDGLQKMPAFKDEQRLCQGWSILLYFTLQILKEVQRVDLKPMIFKQLQPTTENPSLRAPGPSHTEIVVDTISDLLSHCEMLGDVRKVLRFMRTGGSVDQEEVLSVCINEEGLALRHTPNAIRNAVTLLRWGKASDSKDFLDPSKTAGSVITRKSSVRRRAVNIFLSKLAPELQQAIKAATQPQPVTTNMVVNSNPTMEVVNTFPPTTIQGVDTPTATMDITPMEGLDTPTGTVAGVSTPTGTMAGVDTPTGTMAGVNTPTGSMAGVDTSTGTVAGVSTPTGTMAGVDTPTGTMARVDTPTGTMAGVDTPTGAMAGVSTPTGTMAEGVDTLTGPMAGVSTPTGTMAGVDTPTDTMVEGVDTPTGTMAGVSTTLTPSTDGVDTTPTATGVEPNPATINEAVKTTTMAITKSKPTKSKPIKSKPTKKRHTRSSGPAPPLSKKLCKGKSFY